MNESVCNSLQKWNHDESRCEGKKLNEWGFWINGDCECNKACKFDEYLDIENCSCEKSLFDKLVLTCEDEILNTTETSLDNKITIFEYNCLIYTFSFIIICTLPLAVVSIGFYYCYTRYRKKEYALSY